MGEAHGDGHFASIAFGEFRCLVHGEKQYETREVFWIILDIFGKDNPTILLSGAAAGDGGIRFVAPSEDLANTSRRVFRSDTFQMRMRLKEAFALSKCNRMRSYGTKFPERTARTPDQLMLDSKNR